MGLMSSVEENKTRSVKIAKEKNTLELQTSKGGANLMDKVIFNRIVDKISETRNLYEKSRARGQNQQVDPTVQLVEIEGHINRVLKFLNLAKVADPVIVNLHRTHLKKEALLANQTKKALQE